MSKEGDGKNYFLGSDIKLAEFFLGADLRISKRGDIEITSDEMNLAQAILHRLRTGKGELTELGHPDYGSNIADYIGQPNSWVTRERLKLAIRDTVRQERRVKEIVSISVNPRLSATGNSYPNKMEQGGGEAIAISASVETKEEESINELESKEVLSHSVFPGTSDFLNTVDIDVLVVPEGTKQPLQITFPLNLEAS